MFEIKLNKFNVVKKESDPKKQTSVHDKYLKPIKEFIWSYYPELDEAKFEALVKKEPKNIDNTVALAKSHLKLTIPTILKFVDKILIKNFKFNFTLNGEEKNVDLNIVRVADMDPKNEEEDDDEMQLHPSLSRMDPFKWFYMKDCEDRFSLGVLYQDSYDQILEMNENDQPIKEFKDIYEKMMSDYFLYGLNYF